MNLKPAVRQRLFPTFCDFLSSKLLNAKRFARKQDFGLLFSRAEERRLTRVGC